MSRMALVDIRSRPLNVPMALAMVIWLMLTPILGAITPGERLAPALGPAPAGQVASSSLPAGASVDWWSATQQEIRRAEYNVTWQEQTYLPDLRAAYQAPNRSHNLRTYFTSLGIRLIPRTGDTAAWEWGLTLLGYGYAESMQPVPPAEPVAQGNRVEYRRGDLTEWYVNDQRGLEQGFTLLSPPARTQADRSPLQLELALSGSLTPALVEDGTALELTTPGGVRVLRYSDLRVTDSAGTELPAGLALSESRLSIWVDDSTAVYPITIDPLATTPNWTAESDQASAVFGWSVGTAGDVNKDGFSDVIVGAPLFDNVETDEGRAFVYHGSAAGLSTTANWTAEGDQANAEFGFSVGTAGDVNGDGYADVIVGARDYDNGQSNEGRAFVYHGSTTGLSTTANWTAEGDQTDAFFGLSVGTAGDVNGDGYAEVIVGAPEYNNGQTDEGRVFVYYGNEGPGVSLDPRQRRANSDVPIAHLGQSDSSGAFRLALLGRTPFGRGQVKLEWEVKPLGTPFDGTGLQQASTWTDSGALGAQLIEIVQGLTPSTPYHWRLRLRYHSATTPFQQFSRWITMPWNGWNEQDLRTPAAVVPPDLIFADGFESGDLSAWSSAVTDGGDLSVTTAAAIIRTYGLQALIDDNTPIYVQDDSPSAEPRYRARFYFDPNAIAMKNYDQHVLFYGDSGTTPVLRVELRYVDGYQLRTSLRRDDGSWADAPTWYSIADAAHFVEVDWRASTAPGANNGGLTFWIDGEQKANLTGQNNDTHRIDRVRLGAVEGIDTTTRGTYFFDSFESRRLTYIGLDPGPLATPPPPPAPLPDLIFADGFESGNFSAWSSAVTDSGRLSVTNAAALVGSFGLQAAITNTNVPIYVQDDSPNAEPRYRARFYFDPNSISMANFDQLVLFYGYSGATPALKVELRRAGGYQLRASLRRNDTSWADGPAWYTITDAPHVIQLDWRSSTAPGAKNGELTFWIDGQQKFDLVNQDNDTRRIDTVQLGAVADVDGGTLGIFYLDAFESRRYTYIGP